MVFARMWPTCSCLPTRSSWAAAPARGDPRPDAGAARLIALVEAGGRPPGPALRPGAGALRERVGAAGQHGAEGERGATRGALGPVRSAWGAPPRRGAARRVCPL